MQGYEGSTYGDRFADVYDEWYPDGPDTAAAVAALGVIAAAVAGGPGSAGRVLELGVGTGRLALPLAAAGLIVTGLDASVAMLERLAAKSAGPRIDAVHGDMAGPMPDGPFAVVVIARNTFFNLTTHDAQQRCLTEVRRVLAPGGRLVLEAFVPDDRSDTRSSVEVRDIGADRVVLFVDRHDPTTQEAWSSFVELTPGRTTFRPCHVLYRRPDQLDAMAIAAGLRLHERWSNWTGDHFDDGSSAHVSIYEPDVAP